VNGILSSCSLGRAYLSFSTILQNSARLSLAPHVGDQVVKGPKTKTRMQRYKKLAGVGWFCPLDHKAGIGWDGASSVSPNDPQSNIYPVQPATRKLCTRVVPKFSIFGAKAQS